MGSRDILQMRARDMAGYSFDCDCGRHHSVDIKKIVVGAGVIRQLPEVLKGYEDRKLMVVYDKNTKAIAGDRVVSILKDANFTKVKEYMVESEDYPIVVPDERVVARLLYETDIDTALLLAVGSGTINDLCKIIAYKMKIASVTIGTAPSMDGYASPMSPLIVDHAKVTYTTQYPDALICDSEIMATAPDVMLRAGFGDIVGKYTALADWQLTVKMNNEYWCQTTVDLVKNAVDKCVAGAERYMQRDLDAIDDMTEALILTGIAMGLVGISRPASGSEHHIAHFFELDALKKGIEHPLHGNSVGVGSIVSTEAYKVMKERFPEIRSVDVPDPDFMRDIYRKVGSALTPGELGVPREVFHDCINNAYRIRPRYTIFTFAKNAGFLPTLADILTERFYGK